MGRYAVYSCNACKKTIELGGPQEYRKTVFGRKEEPHVGGKKVDGLWIVLWCPKCKVTEKKILVEFSRTCSPIEVWGHTAPVKPEYQKEQQGQFNCSTCKTYMLDTIPPETPCPCHKGTLGSQGFINT
ncbi:hypothetical protein GF342_02060 [Candidatus Woesearchaeota archaeon]|nr:hypothetical protein [Candidatus Woesearchaeota archaeon]